MDKPQGTYWSSTCYYKDAEQGAFYIIRDDAGVDRFSVYPMDPRYAISLRLVQK